MSAPRTCGRCGAPVTAFATEGFCSACMLETGLGNAAEAPTFEILSSGQKLGDYELLEEVARGGMGVVFRARQISLNRIVALKMILTGRLASEIEVQRFRDEARAAAALHHPNIVAIHEVGEIGGQPYFSMDLVEGTNLADAVRQGPFAPARAAACVKAVAEAIQYAHEHGILHRDLKPSNVLIDDRDTPHVTDFGLAKRLEDSQPSTLNPRPSPDPQLTVSGQVLGSPNFMPPEQAAGKHRELTPASDVYSLGALLYDLLTGRPPFLADNIPATLRLVAETEPVAPRLLAPSVPRDLETICLKCLEKTVQRRYSSARALGEELDRFLHNEPIRARPIGPAERAWRWCRRKPTLAAATAVAAGLLVAVAVVSTYAALRIEQARQRAVTSEKMQETLRRDAQAAQASERLARARAETRERAARQSAYASDLKTAALAIDEGNLRLAIELLSSHQPDVGQEDLRGFEWRYLWRLSQGDQRQVLRGHTAPVYCLAYSPDGLTLASGGADRSVMLWNTETGQRVGVCAGHSDTVISVAFSNDGELLASGGEDGLIRFWELRSQKIVWTLTNSSPRLAFSGSIVAIGTGGSYWVDEPGAQTELWDYVARRQLMKLPESGSRVAFSPDGRFLATSSRQWQVKLWDPTTGRELKSMPRAAVCMLGFSPDSRILGCAASGQRELDLWNLTNSERIVLTNAISDNVLSFSFSPDGRTLATANQGHTINLWDVAARKHTATLRGHTGEVSAVAFSPDGKSIASAGFDNSVRMWNPAPVAADIVLTNALQDRFRWVGHPVFSADGETIAFALATGGIQVCETATGRAMFQSATAALPAAFSADGEELLVRRPGLGNLESVNLRLPEPSAPNSRRPPFSETVFAEALSPDHKLIGTAYWRNVELRNTATGASEFAFKTPSAARCLEFSHDGQLLGSGHFDRTARIWDLTQKRLVESFGGFDETVGSLSFSPDDKLLACGCFDSKIKIFHLDTKQEVATLAGHKSGVVRVAFSRDGKTLASSSDDSTVKLWNLATGRELITFQTSRPVCFLSFTARDSLLAAGEADVGLIHLWHAPALIQP